MYNKTDLYVAKELYTSRPNIAFSVSMECINYLENVFVILAIISFIIFSYLSYLNVWTDHLSVGDHWHIVLIIFTICYHNVLARMCH